MRWFLLSNLLFFGALDAADLSDLTWRIQHPGIEITDCKEDATGDLIIPPTIDNFPVTRIGNDAFKDCSQLTSVAVPESVVEIGRSAFNELQ